MSFGLSTQSTWMNDVISSGFQVQRDPVKGSLTHKVSYMILRSLRSLFYWTPTGRLPKPVYSKSLFSYSSVENRVKGSPIHFGINKE